MSEVKIKPLADRVLVKPQDAEERTASGIIIPDSAKEKNKFAKVVAISNIDNSEIAVGETVLYKQYSGTEVKFEGKEYLLIPYDAILAKIVETESI